MKAIFQKKGNKMKGIHPVITEEKQKVYEKIFRGNKKFENTVPWICGVYGRACRKRIEEDTACLCMCVEECSLRKFVAVVETIKEQCEEKENIGIDHLFDSDIYEIQEKLRQKYVYDANFSYIENVLEALTKEDQEENDNEV